jgi:hypothetical protein
MNTGSPTPYPQQIFDAAPQQAYATLRDVLSRNPLYAIGMVDDSRMLIAFTSTSSQSEFTANVQYTPDGRALVQVVPTDGSQEHVQEVVSQLFSEISSYLAPGIGANPVGPVPPSANQPGMRPVDERKFSKLTVLAIILSALLLILALSVKSWNLPSILMVFTPVIVIDGFAMYITHRSDNGGRRGALFARIACGITVLALVIASVWAVKESRRLNTPTVAEPVSCEQYEWPNSDIAQKLPQPKSKTGEMESDSSSGFMLDVCDTSKAEFDAYVNAVSDKGYKVNYQKTGDSYSASAPDGSTISLQYEVNRKKIMSIQAQAAKPASEKPSTKPSQQPKNKDSSSGDDDAKESTQSPGSEQPADFRKTVDEYESFMNSYIDFMNTYKEEDDPTSMLKEYNDTMSQYTNMSKKWESIDTSKLSAADVEYYNAAQARVNEKLAKMQ